MSIFLGAVKGKQNSIELSNSNLYLIGFGLDSNGNSIVKLHYPNQRGFSIQTNGVLRETNYISDRLPKGGIKNLTKNQLNDIENEVIKFIKSFGSKIQKSKLRTY
jgi:hypothetical protein